MNNVMNTYNKKIFDPWHMTSDDVDIKDIAHALSLLCRGCGHVKFFYSVGLHCINCANEAKLRNYNPKIQLACLLHDASEAYISDIIRPVKSQLLDYQKLENKIINTIYNHFNLQLTNDDLKKVKEIDDDMLKNEMPIIFSTCLLDNIPKLASKPIIEELPFKMIETNYLNIFNKLK